MPGGKRSFQSANGGGEEEPSQLAHILLVRKLPPGQSGFEVYVSRAASEVDFKNIMADTYPGIAHSNATSDVYWKRNVYSGRDLCELCLRAEILGYSYATPEDEAKAKEIFLNHLSHIQDFVFKMKK